MAIERDNQMESRRLTTPNPDPTARTVEALLREIAALKELHATRFEAYDKAIALLQANADKAPSISVIEERVRSLQSLHDEKFKSIAVQFAERDTRTEQTSRDSKVAVDAALQAAKEAVEKQNASSALAIAKSEASTAKQIEQIVATFGETTKGLTDKIEAITKGITDRIEAITAGVNDKIEAVKDRITALDKTALNLSGQVVGKHETWGSIGGTVSVVGAAVVVVVVVIEFLMHK